MFVDSTLKSELSEKLRKILKKYNIKIKVQEKAGSSIKKLLTKLNPFKNPYCKDNTCRACINSNSNNNNLNCKSRDVVYEILCECGDTYIGETSRSIDERFIEHIVGYERHRQNLFLSRHVQTKHNVESENPNFELKILVM